MSIDRRQVYAYDPAGSRPPAQRWIDLHAVTRARDSWPPPPEIGVAQKVVRLRMLDRFANRADRNNQMDRAAAFLVQAARSAAASTNAMRARRAPAAAVSIDSGSALSPGTPAVPICNARNSIEQARSATSGRGRCRAPGLAR